MLKRKAKI